jgi:hypothetical protein
MNGLETLTDVALDKILGGLDFEIKISGMLALRNLYLDGHAPGHPASEVFAYSEAERNVRADAFAQSGIESTTMRSRDMDKAYVQKMVPFLARLWNEPRGVLGNRFHLARQARNHGRNVIDAARKGEYGRAGAEAGGAGAQYARYIALGLFYTTWFNLSRGDEPFPTGESEDPFPLEGSSDELKQFPEFVVDQITSGKVHNQALFQLVPLISQLIYGAETGRGVTFPMFKAMEHLGGAIPATMKFADEAWQGASFQYGWLGLTDKQRKDLLHSGAILVKGFPIGAWRKYTKIGEELGFDLGQVSLGETAFAQDGQGPLRPEPNRSPDGHIEKVVNDLDQLLSDMGTDPKYEKLAEEVKDVINYLSNGITKVDKKVVNDAIDRIKIAESLGNPNAVNPHNKDAQGLFQFIKSTWNRLRFSKEGKKAGLTQDGRFDPKQSLAAMKIYTDQNIKKLQSKKIPVNELSIYYMHHFDDIEEAKKIFLGPRSKSMKGSKTLKPMNKKQNPGLKGAKTAGDVRDYLLWIMDEAEGKFRDKQQGKAIRDLRQKEAVKKVKN